MSYYRIDWDAIARRTPAEQMEILAQVGEDVQRITSAARTRLAVRTYNEHNTGHGAVKAAAAQLQMNPVRLKQLRNNHEENNTMVTVNAVAPAQLHRQYSGQSEPQPCYVEVDLKNQVLMADYNAEVGNAVPFAVFHGVERRYPIPALTSTAANDLLEQIRPLAERMISDWEEEWDGNNHVAVLGDDAQAAEAEIVQLTEQEWMASELVTVWDTDGAISGSEAEDYDIDAETTDERLDQIEAEILENLKGVSGSDEVVLEGVADHLRQLRDDADDEDDE